MTTDTQTPLLTVNCLLVTTEGLVTFKGEDGACTLPGATVLANQSCYEAAENALKELFPGKEFLAGGMLGMYDDPSRVSDRRVVSVAYTFKVDEAVVAPEGEEIVLVKNVSELPEMKHDFSDMVKDFEKLLRMQQEQMVQQHALQQMMQQMQPAAGPAGGAAPEPSEVSHVPGDETPVQTVETAEV